MVKQDYLTNLSKQLRIVNTLNENASAEGHQLLEHLINQAKDLGARYLMEIRQERFVEDVKDVGTVKVRNWKDDP